MTDSGVFAVARKIWEDEDFAPEPFTQREAWMWLVGAAVWCERRTRGASRRPIKLQRGEFSFALSFMAEKWKWSKSRVDRFISVLENRDMIRDASRDGEKVYIIRNYNEYQVVGIPKRDDERDAKRDASGTTAGRERDKEETFKHSNIEKEEPKKEVRAKRAAPKVDLPPDFPTPELFTSAQGFWNQKGRPDLSHSVRDEAEHFRDHHLKLGNRFADWPAAWRTWQRTALKYPPKERENVRRGAGKSLDATWRGVSDFIGEDREDSRDHAGGGAQSPTPVAAPRALPTPDDRGANLQGGIGSPPRPVGGGLRVAAIERDGSDCEISTVLRGFRSSA